MASTGTPGVVKVPIYQFVVMVLPCRQVLIPGYQAKSASVRPKFPKRERNESSDSWRKSSLESTPTQSRNPNPFKPLQLREILNERLLWILFLSNVKEMQTRCWAHTARLPFPCGFGRYADAKITSLDTSSDSRWVPSSASSLKVCSC